MVGIREAVVDELLAFRTAKPELDHLASGLGQRLVVPMRLACVDHGPAMGVDVVEEAL